ncbi:MAG: protease HtpX, partial [Rhodospirillaceae bacterium]|nr:protease HtpX [Rhodospirillaceae bacterium]
MSNYFRTALLLAALTAIFMVGGFLLAGPQGIVIALGVAAAINLFAWWNSGSAVLRYYKARELNDPTHPLYRIVAQLADRSGLPMPRVYVIDNPQPNAFA